jgi:transposase InsO family protein
LWVADATCIPCAEGVFWLAAVRDAFSNRIVGWRCSDRCDTDLILGALEYAVWTRGIRDGEIIHHSDRGSNYTSLRFAQRLDDHGILASMGSVGDSYDNALMENFFSTLKTELVYRSSWRTREEAENALFAYIDAWYNTERIQPGSGGSHPTSTSPPGATTTPCWTINPQHPLAKPIRLPPGSKHSELPGEPHTVVWRGSTGSVDGGQR